MGQLIASSFETIAVLRKLDFQIRTTSPTAIVLAHEDCEVTIPRDATLEGEALRTVLLDAHVPEATFAALLTQRASQVHGLKVSIR